MINKNMLQNLPFTYDELESNVFEGQLRIHHNKHRKAYVNSANNLFEKIDRTIKRGGVENGITCLR